MAELLPNGLHEKVMIYSIRYITKIRLDAQFVKKIPSEMVRRGKKKCMTKIIVFTVNVPLNEWNV